MLTIFTMPKPFVGHIAVIQRNALAALTRLKPRPQIIIFGDETGTAEIARELGITHVPAVECNEHGTPVIRDFFEKARQLAEHHLLCYLNADIILLSDFMHAIRLATRSKRRFLMVGQRWDLDVTEPLTFAADWETALRQRAHEHGQQHDITGVDYFVFPRDLACDLPPMLVGRAMWDNWFLYHARAHGLPLIDATRMVLAIHQNHHYGHVAGGQTTAYKGAEAQRNMELAGGMDRYFTLRDATHELTSTGLKRFTDRWHVRRWLLTLTVLHPALGVPVRILRKTIEWTHPLRARLGMRLPKPRN